MKLSFLTNSDIIPGSRGCLRFFVTAVALCSSDYVQAETAPDLIWDATESATWSAGGSTTWKDADGTSATYEDGTPVKFGDTTHAASRKVTIAGTVAPGDITVDTGTITADNMADFGLAGGVIVHAEEGSDDGNVHAQMLYGYVFEGGVITGNACITKSGNASLILNSANSFTGGVTVNEGALYLGTDNAAGTGTITLNTDCSWNDYLNDGSGSFTPIERRGAELIINHNHRTATVTNAVLLSGSGTGGQAHISYGYATYGDVAKLPSAVTRNVQLTGGVYGDGDLYLHGYSYATQTQDGSANYNYVSNFTINNSSNSQAPGKAFSGTVYLHNNFNRSITDESTAWADWYLGGAVQLTLQDDVFAEAVIDMTRDANDDKIVGWPESTDVGNSVQSPPAMTSDNVLVLNDSSSLAGLEAEFTGKAWRHWTIKPRGSGSNYAEYVTGTSLEEVSEQVERWRVRVVSSDGNNTLTLHDDTDTTHTFDGVVGFEQSYVTDEQSYINEWKIKKTSPKLDPTQDEISAADASFTAGGGTLGKAGLSLVKSGKATQYIHSANLNNVTIKGGTLGFNHLSLSGNLSMTGGTTLQLGTTTDAGWDTIEGTHYITSTAVTIGAGKVMSVSPAVNVGGEVLAGQIISTVKGNVTLDAGAILDFSFQGMEPSVYNQDNPLLTVEGNLTLSSGSNVIVDFPGLQYFVGTDKYYLAQVTAGYSITAAELVGTSISLGHGYFGKLGLESEDTYLILTIEGSNTRTWTGADTTNIWVDTGTITTPAPLWKEDQSFTNKDELVVLFGNTIPAISTDAPHVVNGTAANKYQESVTVDGEALDAQRVQIQESVTPDSVIINSDYYVGDTNGAPVVDGTNYYFTAYNGSGSIDGTADLIKQGAGTAVIATNNSFSGGSLIEGGRLVMQHVNALGAGGITIQKGATLQGAFGSEAGEAMTIGNTITVKHVAGYGVDAVLRGTSVNKLIVDTLIGSDDSILMLQGNSSSDNSYGVFEVNDASCYSGTVRMAGYLNGQGTNGNVQLDISARDTNSTWVNATIDLSTTYGSNRTVLALNPTTANSRVQLDVLKGTGINSSVVNMGTDAYPITLEISGTSSGVYQGVLGYGDFQKSDGSLGHDSGNADGGALNVMKQGNSTQSVRSAWLDTLTIGSGGGNLVVTEDLVVKTLDVAHGSHLLVGTPGDTSYGLNVGSGGILAIEGSGIGGTDAFAGVGAGIAPGVTKVPDPSGGPGAMMDVVIWPDKFIQFSNGATITAAGDWFTKSPEFNITLADQEKTFYRDIKIADGANVTFNTHHYTADEALYGSDSYRTAHVMHLLGNMSGNNVSLTFNNELISAGALIPPADSGEAVNPNGHYKGDVGEEMGFVAIKDIHQFTGQSHITVEDMTVLQVTENNADAATTEDTLNVLVRGDNAALQFTSQDAAGVAKTEINQYVDKVSMESGAHVLVGGELKSSNGGATAPDVNTGVGVDITNRYTDSTNSADNVASLSNIYVKSAINGENITSAGLGGDSNTHADIVNSHLSTKNENGKLTVHNANMVNSLVQLHNDCMLNLETVVHMDFDSAVHGTRGVGITPTSASEYALTNGVEGAVNAVYVSQDTTVELALPTEGTKLTLGNNTEVVHYSTSSFQDVNILNETGAGLTLVLADDIYESAAESGAQFIAIQISGTGRFRLSESDGILMGDGFSITLASGGNFQGYWVTSDYVSSVVGSEVSSDFIWVGLSVPEPSTATLSLLALTLMVSRRRRLN